MFKKYAFISLLLLGCNFCFSQLSEKKCLELAGFKKVTLAQKNDTIVFITSEIGGKPKPTIIFLQGSLALPIIFSDENSASSMLPFDYKPYSGRFNFVIIARKGIPLNGSYEKDSHGFLNASNKTPEAFTANDNLKYRVFQAKSVIEYLLRQSWVDKRKLYVVGHSEGYRVAAKLSENNKKIAKLVCMSADPFNRTAETMAKERISCFETVSDTVAQSNIDRDLKDFRGIGTNIESYRSDPELYNWASYYGGLSYESLKRFSNPILIVYGTNDYNSIHNDLLPMLLPKNDLEIKAYPDLDHNYFRKEYDKNGKQIEDSYHWDRVFSDVANWLLSAKKK